MDIQREELSRIKELLKQAPRGMNVLEIAKAIKMNRQSVAKYLEMLEISGHVDVKKFGPSKVYYISQRLPLSAMISLSSDMTVVIDKDLQVINANDTFLEFINANREDVLYKKIDLISFPFEFKPDIMPIITEAINGKASTIEAYYKKRNNERFFSIKFIPVVFDDSGKGATVTFEDITSRKRMEDALRESEERFRILTDMSHGAIVIHRGGRFLDVNKAAEKLSGYSREELLKFNFWEFIHPSDQEMVKNNGLSRLRNEQIPSTYEARIQTKSGETRWVELIGGLINYKGMSAGIITFFDITDHKSLEDALKKSEARLVKVQQIAHLGNYDWDIANNKLYWSDETYRIWGYMPGEIVPTIESFFGSIHPDDKQIMSDQFKAHLNSKIPFDRDFRIIRRDGSVCWIHSDGEYYSDESGKPVRVVGTVMDITERKNAEEKMSYLASFPITNPNPIIEIDEAGQIKYTNPMAESKFPDLKQSGLSHPVLDGLKEISDDLKKCNKQLLMREVVIDGQYYDEVIQRIPDKKIIRIYTTDITGFKQAMEERIKLQDRLHESDEQLSAILYVTESVATTLELDELLDSILDRLIKYMDADAGGILIQQGYQLHLRASRGCAISNDKYFCIPIGTGFTGRVAESQEPLYIEDIQTDPGVKSLQLINNGVRSVIGVPMRYRGILIGVMYVSWLHIHPFNKKEQEVLQIIADRCGAAIVFAELYEQLKSSKRP